jgi:hypothetical protein
MLLYHLNMLSCDDDRTLRVLKPWRLTPKGAFGVQMEFSAILEAGILEKHIWI